MATKITKTTTKPAAAKAAPKTGPKAAAKVPGKSAAARAAAASAKAAKVAAAPVEAVEADTGTELKKKELVELVVERSGLKKKEAKPAVEAMLAILGEALAGGREINLQPLGKLKITRVKELGNGKVMTTRIRQSDQAAEGASGAENEISAKEALAEDAD